MIHIRFIAADQSVQDIQGKPGQSVMDAAVAANVSPVTLVPRVTVTVWPSNSLTSLPSLSTNLTV